MATYHELLAIVRIAQEAHEKPESEGGHDGPLNLHCFLTAARLNAKAMGFSPGILLSAFKTKFPVMLQKGWIYVCDERCGVQHFVLTDEGLAQLQAWNELGCKAHEAGVGARATRHGRKCQGRIRLKSPDYGKAA